MDTDRCVCGGVVVYFEDGDTNGNVGEGCEAGTGCGRRRRSDEAVVPNK
jgi:hypothetical protein